MERFLYKAKRKDNGEWVEGFYFFMSHNDDMAHIHHFIMPLGTYISKGTTIENIQVEVDPVTVCQCTGLKDKNGKLIWENDIVALDSLDGFVVEYDTENARFIFNGEHRDKDYGYCGFHLYAQKSIEIKGSRFDNPELLEQEDNDEI